MCPPRVLEGTLILCVLTASCARDDGRESERPGSPPPVTESARTVAPATTLSSDSLDAHSIELVEAATDIVRFLRGEVAFDRIHLADIVSLYLGLEEGRTRRTVERELLRDRGNWKVHSESLRHTYSFVPPNQKAELRARVGRHVNCGDYPLSATFPELGRFPHVGTTLWYGSESCLQTWNVTFVFDTKVRPLTLVAAVYDQPEW